MADQIRIPETDGVSGTFAALDKTRPTECSGPQMFTYSDTHHIRILRDADGEPQFVLADVCRALEITRSASNVAQRLDPEGVRQAYIPTAGGQQRTIVISEAALYEVVIRSDKPEAVEFRRWVTREVLPAIRKTGTYSRYPAAAQQLPSKKQLAQWVVEAEERAERAETKVAELEPKAEFYDELMDADGTYSMGAVANMLHWGRNVMFRELRRSGVLQGNNLPYQRYAHHFKVVPGTYTNREGETVPTATTKVLPSGIEFLRKKLDQSPVVTS